jgi:surface polysaccharide O-acyltransferase-like enzyme
LNAVIASLTRPLQALRLSYIPLLMVYFAYGALGLIDVTRDFWVKESLKLSPAELASIGVWLTLPWTVKMVFGELVDCVPILGSQRRSYILIGALCTATGLVTLAGAAGQWITTMQPHQLYVLGSLLIVLGTVIQDVVADAMSTEVVSRVDADGKPRPDESVRADLGMVQVLGRIFLSLGILAVAGLSGVLAFVLPREMVFLVALVVPAISVTGVFLIKSETAERRPIDWRILGGGIVFGAAVVALGVGGVPFAQEFIFVISMGVVCGMLIFVTRELDHKSRMIILYAAIIIFAFRATPSVGDGYFWFSIDVLKFDEAFYGILRQTSAIIAVIALWLLAKQITEYSVAKTLFWIAVAGTILTLPSIGLYYGLHHWTEEMFGFGARVIAFADTAASSPFAQLSIVPLLTLTAYYAPAGHRATWFALMASLMNLALVAGQLQTKYLNEMYAVGRGDYDELGVLLITVTVLGLVVPLTAILLFGRRV